MGYDSCLLKPANEEERLASLFELDLLETRHFPELDRLTALAADAGFTPVYLHKIFCTDHCDGLIGKILKFNPLNSPQ